ncbi:hypothetical protein GWG65_26720 [Bradyrhizobium sp. CSA207]|uniref:hypothetical protein n=1 Tax=Bradyrhizobium sp. CSA207 TaxID=2698826 RepID=UPI0023AF2688|nr:hypothetical protein [Bradyrhizobium sp. CSA207]MDE5444974.1 hypothetical protein [Bradyrhizobium sp. CSA207]
MKQIIALAAFAVMCSSAFAQNTGPAPQTGMERPENTNGATPKGAMDTTGMNVDRANQSETKDKKATTRQDPRSK